MHNAVNLSVNKPFSVALSLLLDLLNLTFIPSLLVCLLCNSSSVLSAIVKIVYLLRIQISMCSGWDKVSASGLRVFWNVLPRAVVVIKSYFQSLCSSKMFV